MTGYERAINSMTLPMLAKINREWWGRTYGVEPAVISECVDARVKELEDIELLRARPEVAE